MRLVLPHYPQPATWPFWRRVFVGAICSLFIMFAGAVTVACFMAAQS